MIVKPLDELTIGEAKAVERDTGLSIDQAYEALQSPYTPAYVAAAVWLNTQPLRTLTGDSEDVESLLDRLREEVVSDAS